MLAPLFEEYETHIQKLNSEVRCLKLDVSKLQDSQQSLIKENEDLSMKLSVKQREYLKLVQDTRRNVNVFDNEGVDQGEE